MVFSAHGVPKSVPAEAKRRNLIYADATCPLVSKVHRGVEQHYRNGRTVLLIGHSGHPEVVGTMGQLPEGAVILVEDVAQAETARGPGSRQPRLRDPDHAVGARDRGHPGSAPASLPVHGRAAARGHLLCHDQPPARRRGDRAAGRADPDHRLAQLVQLGAPGRGGPCRGLSESSARAERGGHGLASARRRVDRGGQRRGFGARKSWSRS